MMLLLFVPRLAGVLALAAALSPIASHGESRPPLDKAVKRCVLIVNCKVEIKDELINYRIVESWKGKYSPDLFYTEPLEGYLYRVGEEVGASRFSNPNHGQEVVVFYSDNAVSAVKKGKILSHAFDDIFVVQDGKVVYQLNSLSEAPESRQTFSVAEFKKAILSFVEGDANQTPKQGEVLPGNDKVKNEVLLNRRAWADDTSNDAVRKKWEAIPLPAKTPFDGDAGKRLDFLTSYRHGYFWAQGDHIWCPTNPQADNLHAIRGWIEGWQAGVAAGGQADLPAKYAPYLLWRDDARRASSKDEETQQATRKPAPAKDGFDPAGRWRLTMPAGFEYDATLEPQGETGEYRLHCGAATLRGVYTLQGRRLAMTKPEDERLVGLVWEFKNPNTLLLTEHPASSQVGSDYTNASLCRKPSP